MSRCSSAEEETEEGARVHVWVGEGEEQKPDQLLQQVRLVG